MQEYLLLTLPLDSVHTEQIMLMQLQDEREFHFFHISNAIIAQCGILQSSLELEHTTKSIQIEMLKNGRVLSKYLLSRLGQLGITGTKKLHKFLFVETPLHGELESIKFQLLKSLWLFKRNVHYPLNIQLEQSNTPLPEPDIVIQSCAPCISSTTVAQHGQCLIYLEKPEALSYKKLEKFIYSLSCAVYFCRATGTLLFHPIFNYCQGKRLLRHCKDAVDQEIIEHKEMVEKVNDVLYGEENEDFITHDETAIKALNILLMHQEENFMWHQQVDCFFAQQKPLQVGQDFFQKYPTWTHKALGAVSVQVNSQSVHKCDGSYFTATLNCFRLREETLDRVPLPILFPRRFPVEQDNQVLYYVFA